MESFRGPISSRCTENNTGSVRDAMKNYWLGYSQNANVAEMLCDSDGAEISKKELPEVLGFLPDMRGKKVLELAGGVGRFTGIIAQQACHVTTVDFMEPFIEESKKNNKNQTNIDYIIDDVNNLEFENESFDLIFSNWLLCYFCEDDLHKLLCRLLMWLKDCGFLFVRESCYESSGNMQVDTTNPSIYRFPECYNNYFQSTSVKSDDHTRWGFSLRFTRNIQSYIKFKGNRNQICWLVQKKRLSDETLDCDYEEFLRNKQNSKKDILRYEKIFGEGFTDIGGLQMLQEFTNKLHFRPEQKVLHVGCGIGGDDIYMAKVCFEIGDITDRQYPRDFFDVIIGGGAMRHVRNKKALMAHFFDWLKAGGSLVISDFCLGEDPTKLQARGSLKADDCKLYTSKEYSEIIEGAGFVEVKSEDRSKQMTAFLKRARMKITENLQEYLEDFSNDDLNTLVTRCNNEVKRYETKDQIWCLFSAQKPAPAYR
ncbi:Phosphoethanolamine N-methyltransferase 3 [Holothuria leucospilota]|uniref:phosphoethanolamine N-methyltransferase n=1 Tax=Holothuria leucospilota TaxID=206669 RepID=A0A9Q0YI39_HOLLE|nr:Phosphoethanolamine N-methyltransferase 3 [Holothuria leucospilota]